MSVSADRQKLVDETYAKLGRLDLLVNNAGVAPKVRADILEGGEESFDRMVNINLKGPYFLTQLVAKRMADAVKGGKPAGKIVTITSGFARRNRSAVIPNSAKYSRTEGKKWPCIRSR